MTADDEQSRFDEWPEISVDGRYSCKTNKLAKGTALSVPTAAIAIPAGQVEHQDVDSNGNYQPGAADTKKCDSYDSVDRSTVSGLGYDSVGA